MAPPQLPEGERRDTVTISKKLYDSVVWAASLLVLGVSGLFWNLHLNDVHQDGILARLEKFTDAGDRCTRETCQNTREILERLRTEVRQHRDDAEEWKRRIVSCEIRVTDCKACKVRFGLKQNGGSN